MTTSNQSKLNAFLKYGLLVMAMITMLFSASAQEKWPTLENRKNATPSADGVYDIEEVYPYFPGGGSALANFLKQNTKYPAADKKRNLKGKAITQFVVEPDGSLSNFKVLRSPSDAMAQEAIRVLKSSPKWVPARQKGKVVRARYIIPISFTF